MRSIVFVVVPFFLQVTPALAKVLLHMCNWNVADIIKSYQADAHLLLTRCQVKAPLPADNNNIAMVSANIPFSSSQSTTKHNYCSSQSVSDATLTTSLPCSQKPQQSSSSSVTCSTNIGNDSSGNNIILGSNSSINTSFSSRSAIRSPSIEKSTNSANTSLNLISSSSSSSSAINHLIATDPKGLDKCDIKDTLCSVCLCAMDPKDTSCLTCCHKFCNPCWKQYFDVEIKQGITTRELVTHLLIFYLQNMFWNTFSL